MVAAGTVAAGTEAAMEAMAAMAAMVAVAASGSCGCHKAAKCRPWPGFTLCALLRTPHCSIPLPGEWYGQGPDQLTNRSTCSAIVPTLDWATYG